MPEVVESDARRTRKDSFAAAEQETNSEVGDGSLAEMENSESKSGLSVEAEAKKLLSDLDEVDEEHVSDALEQTGY